MLQELLRLLSTFLMLVLVVTWFCCDRDSPDWVGNSLWYLGRHRKCCPGVWTLVWVEQQTFGLSLVSIYVLLRFLTFHNITSVLNGWLDAPLQGLLGSFLFSTEILFLGLTIYLIPSVQLALGGTVPMLRTPEPPFTIWSNLDCTSHKHKHTFAYTLTLTHRFSKYPNGPHFSISTVYSLTKNCII